MNGRDYKVSAIIGEKRQGKSILLRSYAEKYMQTAEILYNQGKISIPKRVLIHDPSEARSFSDLPTIRVSEIAKGIQVDGKRYKWVTGVRRIIEDKEAKDVPNLMDTISRYFRNGLVVFDEARDWMDSNRLKPWQKELFTKHSNKGLDLLYVFHNWMDIPIGLRPHIWTYIMFRTPEKPDSAKWFATRRFPNPEALYELWCKVEKAKHKEYDGKPRVQHYEVFDKSFNSVI